MSRGTTAAIAAALWGLTFILLVVFILRVLMTWHPPLFDGLSLLVLMTAAGAILFTWRANRR